MDEITKRNPDQAEKWIPLYLFRYFLDRFALQDIFSCSRVRGREESNT